MILFGTNVTLFIVIPFSCAYESIYEEYRKVVWNALRGQTKVVMGRLLFARR